MSVVFHSCAERMLPRIVSVRALVTTSRGVRRIVGVLALACVSARSADAQCLEWQSGVGIPAMPQGSSIGPLAVFDDGGGPALFAGGQTMQAGMPTAFIARWNGSFWTPVGAGIGPDFQSIVTCMAVFDDGSGPALIVGGHFRTAGGLPANDIAKWDGSQWSPLGRGLSGPGIGGTDGVDALTVFDEGSGPRLFVGGSFSQAGSVAALDVAKWDGSSWSAAGVIGYVFAFAAYDDGTGLRLYAGSSHYVQRWNGARWEEPILVGESGGYTPGVFALKVFDDGSGPALYLGGHFAVVGGVPARNMARWNGSSCSSVGSGMGQAYEAVSALSVFDDGSGRGLYAAGTFVMAGGVSANHVAKWRGSTWSPLASGVSGSAGSLAVFDDGHGGGPRLFVGGEFASASGVPSPYVAVWSGCAGPGTLFCFGDGIPAACPCSNSGMPEHGCENSASTGGGLLASVGSTHPDSVVLRASGELPGSLSIFLQSDVSLAPVISGDGLRCIGGHRRELYVRAANQGVAVAPEPGEISISSRSAALGDPIGPGSVRFYQVYYRDSAAAYCSPPHGRDWNVTNAVRITW